MSLSTWRDIWGVIDFREMDDVRELTPYTIQSQYAASERITGIAEIAQDRMDLTRPFDLFYDNIFNIYTARGYGLDLWGRIVGIGRTILDPVANVSLTLDDSDYRPLLLYKALANISASTAAAQNQLLNTLIATGVGGFPTSGYVLEVDVMVIRWVFEGGLDDMQRTIFYVAGQLARGAGVGWELYTVPPDEVFGFDGSEMNPFNQAPFAPDDALISNRG